MVIERLAGLTENQGKEQQDALARIKRDMQRHRVFDPEASVVVPSNDPLAAAREILDLQDNFMNVQLADRMHDVLAQIPPETTAGALILWSGGKRDQEANSGKMMRHFRHYSPAVNEIMGSLGETPQIWIDFMESFENPSHRGSVMRILRMVSQTTSERYDPNGLLMPLVQMRTIEIHPSHTRPRAFAQIVFRV